MKRSLSALLCMILIASPFLMTVAEYSFSRDPDAIEEAIKSVLFIILFDENNEPMGTGSGFVAFDSKTIVTNYHVIEGANHIYAKNETEKIYKIDKVLLADEEKDIAILSLGTSTSLMPLKLADISILKRGQAVVAIGSPKGYINTVSTGIVSALYNREDTPDIQFTAPVSHGSSGGALFNDAGEVIGVTSALDEAGQNINFAVGIYHVLDLYRAYNPYFFADHQMAAITPSPTPKPTPTLKPPRTPITNPPTIQDAKPKYPLEIGERGYVGTADDPYLNPDIKNISTEDTVDSFTLTYYCVNMDGDLLYFDRSALYYSEYTYTISIAPQETLKPGKVSMSLYGNHIKEIYVAVTGIHTADGKTYKIPENEWKFDSWTLN